MSQFCLLNKDEGLHVGYLVLSTLGLYEGFRAVWQLLLPGWLWYFTLILPRAFMVVVVLTYIFNGDDEERRRRGEDIDTSW